MAIKGIGFDYGGVLINRPGGTGAASASRILGVDIETYRKVYFAHNHLINTDAISRNEFWKKIADELGRSEKVGELLAYVNNLPPATVIPEMIQLVDNLRKQYRVGMLSNNTADRRATIDELDIPRHFDVAMISAEIGYQKPDPQAFKIFFDALGVPASESIFIDDASRSLETAREVGFHPILFTTYDCLLRDLSELGVLLA